MTGINRRDVLRGGAAVGAVGVTAGVATTAAHALASDHELIALEKTWLALRREEKRTSEQYHKAMATLPAWARVGKDQFGSAIGWPELDTSHPAFANCWKSLSTRPIREHIEGYNRNALAVAEVRASRHPDRASEIVAAERRLAADRMRHFEERVREQDECRKRACVTALIDDGERRGDEITAIEDKMADIPAHTIEGVAIKLRLYSTIDLGKTLEDAEPEWCNDRLLIRLVAETDRLAGRAQS